MSEATCRAAKVKTIRGTFGERCGKPATDRDFMGRPVCAECLAFSEEARRDANSVGSVIAEIWKRRAQMKGGDKP
jgi:hypothetical protein